MALSPGAILGRWHWVRFWKGLTTGAGCFAPSPSLWWHEAPTMYRARWGGVPGGRHCTWHSPYRSLSNSSKEFTLLLNLKTKTNQTKKHILRELKGETKPLSPVPCHGPNISISILAIGGAGSVNFQNNIVRKETKLTLKGAQPWPDAPLKSGCHITTPAPRLKSSPGPLRELSR